MSQSSWSAPSEIRFYDSSAPSLLKCNRCGTEYPAGGVHPIVGCLAKQLARPAPPIHLAWRRWAADAQGHLAAQLEQERSEAADRAAAAWRRACRKWANKHPGAT